MARPRRVQEDDVIITARDVFLEQGASGATQEIARRLKVSPTILYKRYGTTERLFLAAMVPHMPDTDEIKRAAAEQAEPREALIVIATRVLKYFRMAAPLILAVIGHPGIGSAGLLKKLQQNPARVLRNEIAYYLYSEAKRRRLSKVHCEAAANLLVSALHSIALFEAMGLEKHALPWGGIKPLVDALWQGLQLRKKL